MASEERIHWGIDEKEAVDLVPIPEIDSWEKFREIVAELNDYENLRSQDKVVEYDRYIALVALVGLKPESVIEMLMEIQDPGEKVVMLPNIMPYDELLKRGNAVMRNDEVINQYCVWSLNGDLDEAEVDRQVKANLPMAVEWCAFVNGKNFKSITGIEHAQVFVRERKSGLE